MEVMVVVKYELAMQVGLEQVYEKQPLQLRAASVSGGKSELAKPQQFHLPHYQVNLQKSQGRVAHCYISKEGEQEHKHL